MTMFVRRILPAMLALALGFGVTACSSMNQQQQGGADDTSPTGLVYEGEG